MNGTGNNNEDNDDDSGSESDFEEDEDEDEDVYTDVESVATTQTRDELISVTSTNASELTLSASGVGSDRGDSASMNIDTMNSMNVTNLVNNNNTLDPANGASILHAVGDSNKKNVSVGKQKSRKYLSPPVCNGDLVIAVERDSSHFEHV